MANENKKAAAVSAAKNAERVTSPSIIITLAVSAVILIAVIVWAVIAKQGADISNKTAMKIDDTEIKGVEYRYNYYLNVNAFVSQYSNYISLFGLDTTKPLDSQTYIDGERTWADYFREQATNGLKEKTLLYNDALSKGYSVSEEDKAEAKEIADEAEAFFKSQGYNPDTYIASVYGKGMTIGKYQEFVEKESMIQRYGNDLIDSFEFGSSDYEKYYNENRQTMDTASFRSYYFGYDTVSATTDEEAEEQIDEAAAAVQTEANKNEAKAKADAMLDALTDEASFENYIVENVLDDASKSSFVTDSTLSVGSKYSDVTTNIGDWVFDSSRAAGDKTVIEVPGGYYVLWFNSCELDKYNTVNIRHIYLSKSTVDNVYEEDGTTISYELTAELQEEADAEVQKKAEDIYNEWKNGEATEDSFSAVAVTYSEDSTAADGGLYSKVTNDYFNIAEINEWLFDEARKSGDSVMIESSYGFHILYFIGEDEPAWEITADNALVNQAYSDYLEELENAANIEIFEDVTSQVS